MSHCPHELHRDELHAQNAHKCHGPLLKGKYSAVGACNTDDRYMEGMTTAEVSSGRVKSVEHIYTYLHLSRHKTRRVPLPNLASDYVGIEAATARYTIASHGESCRAI